MADTRRAALSAVAILLLAAGGWAAYSTDLLRMARGDKPEDHHHR